MDISYEQILARAAKEADSFSLVWRHEFKFSNNAAKVEKALQPHQLVEQVTSTWPGTELFGGSAVVRTYSLNDATLAILAQSPGVYGWLAPEYPEDLAFFSKGKLVFWSIAHEEESGFAS